MASGDKSGGGKTRGGAGQAPELLHPPRRPLGPDALVTAMGGGTLDFAAMLAIADVLPVMIAYVNRDYRYAFVNRPLADWLERPREAILGRTMGEILGAANFEQRRPMLDAALAGERSFFASEFEFGARGAVAVQTDYVPWADPSGSVRGIIVLVQDVTESRTAERAIRESEARFRRIADSAPAMMWVTRLDRVRDFVNDAYCSFVGLAREGARTLDWRNLIHPDDVDRIVAESIAGEASLQPFTLEGRYRRHDGAWRWLLRSVSQPRSLPKASCAGSSGRDRHHARQGGRARASPRGRRAHRRAGQERSPLPRGVRGGARGNGPARTRRNYHRGEQPAGILAPSRSDRGRGQ